MKLPRRKFLQLAAGAAALPAASRFAWAQAYPVRPVRLIIGYPPGSGPDINARLIGQWLSERLGQPFVIDNRRVPEQYRHRGGRARARGWLTLKKPYKGFCYKSIVEHFLNDFSDLRNCDSFRDLFVPS